MQNEMQNNMQKSRQLWKMGFTCFNIKYFEFRYCNFLISISKLMILPLIRTRFLYWISPPFCCLKLKLKAGKFTIHMFFFLFSIQMWALSLSKLGDSIKWNHYWCKQRKVVKSMRLYSCFMMVYRKIPLEYYGRFIFTIKWRCFTINTQFLS